MNSFSDGPSLRSAIGTLYDVDHEVDAQWREIAAALKDRRLHGDVERLLAGRKKPLWRRVLRQLRWKTAEALRAAASRGPATTTPR
jgi:hypothetical protein